MFAGISLEYFLLAASILMVVSIFASTASSSRFSIPALLIFLCVGMLAGSEGIGGIQFDNVQAAQSLGVVALVFILFAGGIDTDTTDLKKVFLPGAALSTIAVFMSAVLVGLFAHFFLKMPMLEGLLLGSIISSTDAAAVFSILRSKNIHLDRRLKTLLEFESGSNDPMAIFLTMTMISFISNANASVSSFIYIFVQQAVLGIVLGALMAYAIKTLLQWLQLGYRGLYPALTFSLVLLTYALTAILGGNGFMAVYVCGLALSMSEFHFKKGVVVFHDSVAWIMQIMVFVTLGMLVFPSQLIQVAWEGIAIAAVLFFIARPVSVVSVLVWFKLPANEIAMTSWVGLRGAAPIVLATFPLIADVPGANYIFNIVFFVVILSVILQGTTVGLAARIFKVEIPAPSESD